MKSRWIIETTITYIGPFDSEYAAQRYVAANPGIYAGTWRIIELVQP